jgi:N-acylneuraminate cytidylyltransferase
MSKVVALIPARAGSKGVPDKNIRLLGGHPLISWSIKACLKSDKIERVIVSTDSAEYASLSRDLGAEAPFLRPNAISGDLATDYDFVVHALDWLNSNGCNPEMIIHIRPTTPLRDPEILDQAIIRFSVDHCATALRSVHEMSESAYKTFEIDQKSRLKCLGSDNTNIDSSNLSRQVFPTTYSANGYVDILRPSFIRNECLLHGDAVIPFITPAVTELDNFNDYEFLEYEVRKNPSLTSRIFGENIK